MDPVWLDRAESDKARISCRISASRSGDFGDMLINVTDAANAEFCLLLPFFADDSRGLSLQRPVVSNPAGIGRLRD